MASVFFKFNYTKEDNKELNEIKTIIVPQLNVVDKIVDGGETTFFVKNLGSGANYDKVVSLGGITSLEMLYPQGTWTGNTWGELLRVTITSYNGKRLNTANVRHINPHDICSIRTEKGETTITTNNRVSAGQYNGFEIYKTASTINDMGTIINALPTQSGGILDAPTDGRTYGRKDSNWQVITDSDLDKYLISGGASWSGTGLVYDVTALEYYFNGDKLAAATQVTLDASDPVNNRLDAIVVDEAGVVSVIKGDASASPISPSVDESHILVQYILVEAGTTEPTIAKEDIYLENVEWTTSTYTTGTATGSIDFDNAVSPKQGVKCISANADARLGARFVRTTSFDPYQYTMLSMWVRFTGSNVATNKSLNVRFENGAGALVANTINLFNFGLQRNLLNVWQLVVIPITSFGALPTSVKGLKIIMTGGTVGQARQWDIDLISLTDNSVPAINEQAFNVLKDGALVGQSSSLNFKGGAVNVTKDAIGGKIDVEVIGGGGSPAGSNNQIQINQSGAFFADSTFQKSDTDFNVGLDHTQQSAVTFTGSGLDDLILTGLFSGTVPTTYTVTIDGVNVDIIAIESSTITGGTFAVADVVTNGLGGTATVTSVVEVAIGDSVTLYTYLGVSISAGTFGSGETIDNGSGVTGTGSYQQNDTFTYTDGTTTQSDIPTSSQVVTTTNGIKVSFGSSTGHTLTDEWTWDYTSVNQNVLDFSNNDYKFQSVFGTDTFGYQIGDNLLGYGIKGAVNTYTNTGGDFGLLGFTSFGGILGSTNQLYFSGGGTASTYLAKNQYDIEVGYGSNKFLQSNTYVTFSYINIIGGIEYGIEQSAGAVTVGNLSSGNNTKITIDDVNEHITISNLPAYDDDTAAGVGGLTTGMVYMTTGSGSAPLNAAGILMIKQ